MILRERLAETQTQRMREQVKLKTRVVRAAQSPRSASSCKSEVGRKRYRNLCTDDDNELMLNVLRCHETY